MRRPSVLFINRVYPPSKGASGRVLRDLARSFAREGWNVTVVTTGSYSGVSRDGGVQVVRVKASENPRGVFAYAWIWLRLLIAALGVKGVNLIVTLTDPPMTVLTGAIYKTLKGARHIHWCHDLYPDVFPVLGFRFPAFISSALGYLSKKAMRHADKVIVIGRCMARYLTYNGLDPKHMTMIPNWPDFELVMPEIEKSRIAVKLNEGRNISGLKPYEEQLKGDPKFRILYAGNIGRAHPVDTLLEAAEILDRENPEIEFMFVGEGPGYEWIARARETQGLRNIRFLPYQPAERLREIMESGDLHLVTMKEEAAGMLVPCKIYSALAVERPTIFIGPSQSEAAKIITDFKAGVVVPQSDAHELVRRIRDFRYNGEDWFAARDGAAQAARIYAPKMSIDSWIERAWSVVKQDIGKDISKEIGNKEISGEISHA